MSETRPQLRLKRKKTSVGTGSTQTGTHGPRERVGPTRLQTQGPATLPSPALPPAPAPAPALSGTGGLWALTLRWVLQEIRDPSGPVPELPPLRPAPTPLGRPAAPGPDRPAGLGPLTDDVLALPEPSSVQTRPDPPEDPPLTTLSPQTHPPPDTSHRPPLREPEGETVRSGGAGGATEALMPSCPMCLLLFPQGFSQMERGAHLAQCLSEVPDDVTW